MGGGMQIDPEILMQMFGAQMGGGGRGGGGGFHSFGGGGMPGGRRGAPKASPVASNSDMMRRRTSPGNSPGTMTTTKRRKMKMKTKPLIPTSRRSCGRGRTTQTSRYSGFVNLDWGSCWLASSYLLISWLSRQSLGRECTFASDMC